MGSVAVSSREAIRHVLYRSGTYGALTWMRRRRGGAAAHLAAGDTRSRFKAIYDSGVWQHGDDATPGSGSGSSMAATTTLRGTLPALLDKMGAETLLDVGCGDFTWMKTVPLSQRYIGVDVVDSVIAANNRIHAGANRRFDCADAIVDELPDADVVMCREILFHLSLADARAVLCNIMAKPRSFIILTSDRQTFFNADIPTGDFRMLNLQVRPFRLPEPLYTVDDSVVCPGRIMGVWRASDLAHLA